MSNKQTSGQQNVPTNASSGDGGRPFGQQQSSSVSPVATSPLPKPVTQSMSKSSSQISGDKISQSEVPKPKQSPLSQRSKSSVVIKQEPMSKPGPKSATSQKSQTTSQQAVQKLRLQQQQQAQQSRQQKQSETPPKQSPTQSPKLSGSPSRIVVKLPTSQSPTTVKIEPNLDVTIKKEPGVSPAGVSSPSTSTPAPSPAISTSESITQSPSLNTSAIFTTADSRRSSSPSNQGTNADDGEPSMSDGGGGGGGGEQNDSSSNVKGPSGQAPTTYFARLGQDFIHEIVAKVHEVFQTLRTLQLPNGAQGSVTFANERKIRLTDQMRNIKVLIHRVRSMYDKCSDNSQLQGLEYMNIESLIPLIEDADISKIEKRKSTDAYKTLAKERDALVEKVELKNKQLKEIIDQMRRLIWEINTMLTMRKSL